ncbi:(deoxy)nucleoside triphosphate pyrophosphohydrolase [Eubacteriales bacterium OttesenSCG-928-N13]|nr:(deoxy)nucleoside triphosphate pyrophosphohydrolase [Eubacteriales bacterium OttesenSCG-928-N13]
MTIPVVAAIVMRDGKILITGQEKPIYGGFLWEFPGGKLEAGESPEQALSRELKEELGIDAHATRVYDVVRHIYEHNGRDVLVLFYLAELPKGEPNALEGQQIAWVSPQELKDYPFAPADTNVALKLAYDPFLEQI